LYPFDARLRSCKTLMTGRRGPRGAGRACVAVVRLRSILNTSTLARRLGQRRSTRPRAMPKLWTIVSPQRRASTSTSAEVPTQMLGVSCHSRGRVRVSGMGSRSTDSRFGPCANFGKLTMPMRPTRAVPRSIFSLWRRCRSVCNCSTTSKLRSPNSASNSSKLSCTTFTPRRAQASTLSSAIATT